MEDPYPVENIDRLGVLMFQTSDNSQLLRRVLWINSEMTIVWSLKHRNTQPSYIFIRENPKNSEPQNGPRRGLDFITLNETAAYMMTFFCWAIACQMSVNAVRGKSKSHWTEKATLPFTMGSNSLQNLIEILILEIFDPLTHGPKPVSSLCL